MSSVKMATDVTPYVINWIKNEFPDIPVIIDRPNVPRPELPYITIMVSSPITKVGSRDSREHVDDTTWNIGGQRRFTMSIRAYVSPSGKGFFDAQDMMIQLQDSLEDDNRRSILTSAGLAVWFSSDILDVTELLETGYEPRAQLDVEFGIASNRETDFGAIETVQIEPTIDGNTEPEFEVPD